MTQARRTHPLGATFSYWNAADGWPIRRMDWPQPAGGAVRGSLIFAGGRGDFIEKYLEALACWHQRRWNVTSFDWRGQGESRGDIVGGHLDSFDSLVEDGAGLVGDWLERTPGPHVAIAHSMGGHLLLRILAERRPSLAAAVLVAPMIGVNASPIPPWLGRIAARTLAGLGLRRRRAWKENEKPGLRRHARQAYLTSSPERYADELWWRARHPGFALGPPSWGWLHAAYDSMARLTPETLAGVELPVLLLGTERDRLVSPAAIHRAAELLPHAELLMFPTAAHELLREDDAVRLAALTRIDAFLDEHAPA